MVETAGNKLRRARQQRQLSLEDAARATKIRANQLADLEADEYSNFANLAYARSFLANYGKYLRVDVRPYMEAFSEANTFGLDDYQYLSEQPVAVYRVPYRRSGRARRPQRRQLIGAAVGLTALVIGVFGWILLVNVHRLGDLNQLASRQEAREKSAHAGPAAGASAKPAESASSAQAPAVPAANEDSLTAPAPALVLPVSAPVGPAAGGAPAPTATPDAVPAQVSIPALAAAVEPAASPALPLPGDGSVVREMLTAHASQPQPQKVVNDRARRP